MLIQKNFVYLVWLLVVCSKGHNFEEYNLDYIFKYVYDMTMEKEYDKHDDNDERILKSCVDKFINKINKSKKISEENKDSLYCIGLRISYGGKEGDMDKLCYYTQQYFDLFEKKLVLQ